MDANTEMLNYIAQNAEMGTTSISKLVEICEKEKECEDEFLNLLKDQLNDYREIYDRCETLLRQRDKEPKNISTIQQVSTYWMINMKTLNDKTSSHISEMLMQGSVMGVSQITKKLDEYKDKVSDEVYSLGERLLKIEDRNLAECRKYLGKEPVTANR